MPVLDADLHLVETIAGIRGIQFVDPDRVGIIGLDGHHRHAFRPVIVGELLDASL